ncbi:hypothetical protein [Burkholderia pseudomallei]|uniref:hypothetical protein n=1 Tax=Burkholderia pseudomallei TaxID=28450 RepID=UPI000F08CEEB|nr:hypothetical protein [Burkholderia pseudomallei]CAJ3073130.1 Uncharacterised protein [Burkholderia pseudomallei]VCK72843.1 Uncharacterised protein [Burkholderia pseudomallei]VCK80001.1 Uncharacterised protein [Burkholderia pseudomallei]VCK80014.1 Uncharacterised protein [Burkholderia pseudomallei]VCK80779.1 Uncharacterised protein [Burkholderia pseudomallei]
MNTLSVISTPRPGLRAPSMPIEVLERDERMEAVEMSIDEQLLALAAVFPRPVQLLVAAALILPADVQDPQVESGRRVGEAARSAYFRFAEAVADVARIRNGNLQGERLTQAIDQAGLDLHGVMKLASERERASAGCLQRVSREAQRVIRAKIEEAIDKNGPRGTQRPNTELQWDFVLGVWSTRASILAQGHALPLIDGYVLTRIHADNDWQ